MRTRFPLLALGLCLAAGTAAWALDSVKTTSKTVAGTVKSVSPTEIVVERSGIPEKVPANEVVAIYFEDESSLMKTARNHVLEGRYQDALDTLGRLKPEDLSLSQFLPQEVDFYRALCAARLALGGSGTIKDAGSLMAKFVKDYPTSYHYFAACEIVGDLLVAMGLYPTAEKYYAQVGAAPWPDYQMRANVAIGRAQLGQGRVAEARQSFQKVLDTGAAGELAKAQQLAATLGLARCTDDPNQAIQSVEAILAKSDVEDVALQAQAYNALGTALRKAGRPKDALLAFLHVDLLYFAAPEAHAEALANLAELWNEVRKTERSVHARRTLEDQYGNSPWAKMGGGR